MGSASRESGDWHAARRAEAHGPLAAEASQHLSSRTELASTDGNRQYIVRSDETIADVARSSLYARGISRPDENSVYDEMQRIAKLSGVSIQDVRPGMPLKGVPADLRPNHFVDAENQLPRPVPGALRLNASGQHDVVKESMHSIAYNALRLRGAPHSTEDQVWKEMNRIAYLNQDAYPQLLINPESVRPGMVLDIADPRQTFGPTADRMWDRDRVMQPGEGTLITARGNSIVAGDGNKVVVNEGARAYLLSNSFGFLRAGQATAYAGANVIAAGHGDLTAYPRARVKLYGAKSYTQRAD
jgi:hypothetical protein